MTWSDHKMLNPLTLPLVHWHCSLAHRPEIPPISMQLLCKTTASVLYSPVPRYLHAQYIFIKTNSFVSLPDLQHKMNGPAIWHYVIYSFNHKVTFLELSVSTTCKLCLFLMFTNKVTWYHRPLRLRACLEAKPLARAAVKPRPNTPQYSRDSKPGAFLPNPGFRFGKPSNPGFGSDSGLGRWRPYASKTGNEIRHPWLVYGLIKLLLNSRWTSSLRRKIIATQEC